VKSPKDGEAYFFGDESGDPTFYDRYGKCIVGQFGCSPILILGFIETQDPSTLRRAILSLHAKVISDPILNRLPSARKTAIAFHAKDDPPEVRYLFYNLIREMEFKTQLIVARKIERVFRERHRGKENEFYDDLVTHLFETALHRFKHNEIVLATRGSRERRKPLEKAIWRAKGRFEKKHNVGRDVTTFKMRFHRLSGEPCLSIVDYMNWAVYRAFVNGDDRYYDSIKSKISVIVTRDMPEFKRVYSRKNPFDVREAAPLGLGS
jgi:hypothetical protein